MMGKLCALALALLLPALGKAKETAKQILCAGNLQQQGVALNSYVGDYDVFPAMGSPGSTEDQCCIYYYGGSAGDAALRPLHAYIPNVNSKRAFISNGVFWCPKDTIGNNPSWYNATNYYWRGASYWYNNCCYRRAKRLYCSTGLPTGIGGRNTSAISSPSTKAMVSDAGLDAFADGRVLWHGKFKGNMVFVDGHVSLLVFAPFTQFASSSPTRWHTGVPGLFAY